MLESRRSYLVAFVAAVQHTRLSRRGSGTDFGTDLGAYLGTYFGAYPGADPGTDFGAYLAYAAVILVHTPTRTSVHYFGTYVEAGAYLGTYLGVAIPTRTRKPKDEVRASLIRSPPRSPARRGQCIEQTNKQINK